MSSNYLFIFKVSNSNYNINRSTLHVCYVFNYYYYQCMSIFVELYVHIGVTVITV